MAELTWGAFLPPVQNRVKPGFHIVVTIAEHVPDVAPKRILRLSIHRLQIFLVKYKYLRSFQLCVPRYKCKALKTCLQPCACDPNDLYGDRALVFHLVQAYGKAKCLASLINK